MRGYRPPGDTPNLKYIEREGIWMDYPSLHAKHREILEAGTADPRYMELIRKVGAIRSSWADLIGYFHDKVGNSFPFHLQGSHVSYLVRGEIYTDVVWHPKFSRIRHISNLGPVSIDIYDATHSRGDHSIVAAMMMELILRHNGFSEHDVNLGILSALLHDIAIPPLSDYGKMACPEELDEERNIDFVLGDGSFDHIFRKYDVDRDEVIRTVRGEGVVGSLLNSDGVDVDKISYTGVDLSMSLNRPPWRRLFGRMRRFNDPYLFDLYEDVEVIDDKPVFTDPERLFKFLMMRALMFEKVYFSPENRGREAYVVPELKGLWSGGKITRKDMLRASDITFLGYISKLVDRSVFDVLSRVASGFREIGRFGTADEANAVGGFVDSPRRFNPATGTLTLIGGKRRSGRMVGSDIVPFRDGYPEKAGQVEEISQAQNYFGVYRSGGPKPDPELVESARKVDRDRRKLKDVLKYSQDERPEDVFDASRRLGKI